MKTRSASFKNTKILATLGPSSDTTEKIIELIQAGIDGVRLNFSHGSYDYYEKVFKNINDACVAASEPIAILVDLQGPKIRVGELTEPEIEIVEGDKIEITSEEIVGTKENISCSYKNLPTDAQIGNKIFIDDGLIKLEVDSINEKSILCNVIEGGIIKPHKGINFPGMKLSLPSMTEKDFSDLDFALLHRVDFIALSFVRHPNDIKILRAYVEQKGFQKNIIAKIEKPEAVGHIDGIIREADGIMVARGDLGVELPPQEVPVIQKLLIRKCNSAGKMVITATQMLESMIKNPVPTRAEVSDVANAVWDGTDVVMLSGETSVGEYAVESVQMMQSVLSETESHMSIAHKQRTSMPADAVENVFDSVGNALANMAGQLKAEAVVSFSRRGRMARAMSKFRPMTKLVVFSDNFEMMNMLRLTWGIVPIYLEDIPDEIKAIGTALAILREKNLVREGGTVIFTSGSPIDEKGKDIWIRFKKA